MSPIAARRLYIRLEAQPNKFGDRPTLVWAVFPYVNRDRDGNPLPIGAPTYFGRNRLAAAHRYADRQIRLNKGSRR